MYYMIDDFTRYQYESLRWPEQSADTKAEAEDDEENSQDK